MAIKEKFLHVAKLVTLTCLLVKWQFWGLCGDVVKLWLARVIWGLAYSEDLTCVSIYNTQSAWRALH